EAFIQLHDFAQRGLSIAYYTEEVNNLMLKCGIAEPEEKTIARYLCGLRKEIYDVAPLRARDATRVVAQAVSTHSPQCLVGQVLDATGSRYGYNDGQPFLTWALIPNDTKR
nr:Gag-Pol polyprotein-like protein [Tanacetum cinerariifolium]